MIFCSLKKIWKHDVTGFKFQSHGAKGRQIPRSECVKHNLCVVRFFTGKSEKNNLLEDFTNCHILLLIHLSVDENLLNQQRKNSRHFRAVT